MSIAQTMDTLSIVRRQVTTGTDNNPDDYDYYWWYSPVRTGSPSKGGFTDHVAMD